MKLTRALGLLLVAIATSLIAATAATSVAEAQYAIDERMARACYAAAAGKCFHDNRVPGLLLIEVQAMSNSEIDFYCATTPSACGASECAERLKVIAGVLPSDEGGNPCLAPY
jgi:hypothetical protein